MPNELIDELCLPNPRAGPDSHPQALHYGVWVGMLSEPRDLLPGFAAPC